MIGRLVRRLGIVTFISTTLSLGVSALLAQSPCPRTGTEKVDVASVGPRLELILADGRTIRLVGLDPAAQTPDHPDREDTARAALTAMLRSQTVTIQIRSTIPDRWGRMAAFAFMTGASGNDEAPLGADASEGGVAATAIAAGLGRYRSESLAHACRPAFVAAEGVARQRKLGLWGDPYYAVLAVDDNAAFAERSGTIVVMEGRLQAVLPGPYRTKLRFATAVRGSYAGHTLAVTILPRAMKTFEAQHVNFRSLIGHAIRVRGLLDQRFGPQIEISGPDDLDILDQTPAAIQPDAAAPTRAN